MSASTAQLLLRVDNSSAHTNFAPLCVDRAVVLGLQTAAQYPSAYLHVGSIHFLQQQSFHLLPALSSNGPW